MPNIGGGQKQALLEAYGACVSLVPEDLRKEFIAIGGTALVLLGSNRKTEDIDFAVSARALHAFFDAAEASDHFRKDITDEWRYVCQAEGIKDMMVPIEFLAMGGGFAPTIKQLKPLGAGYLASLGELVRMKARAYMSRESEGDRHDFIFLIQKMEENGDSFEGIEFEQDDIEDIQDTAKVCGEGIMSTVRQFVASIK